MRGSAKSTSSWYVVAVFVFAWCVGGVLFFIAILQEPSDTDSWMGFTFPVHFQLKQFASSQLVPDVDVNGERVSQIISEFEVNSLPWSNSSDGADPPTIFLDWPIDDRLFSLSNYRALETVLHHYGKRTPVRVLLATSLDSYYHKNGNALSVTHFEKYKKRGYDLQVNINFNNNVIANDFPVFEGCSCWSQSWNDWRRYRGGLLEKMEFYLL